MSAQRAPSAPPALVPGLIRLQAGATTSPNKRSRQRKQQNRQSRDGANATAPPQTTEHQQQQQQLNPTTSPKRVHATPASIPQPQTPAKQHQQQHYSAKKAQALPKQAVPAFVPSAAAVPPPAVHRSPPRSPTRVRAHKNGGRNAPHQDLADLSFSSADDSDDASGARLPQGLEPSDAFNAANGGAASIGRSGGRNRRNRHKQDKGAASSVAPVVAAAASDPTLTATPASTTPAATAIPIASPSRNGRNYGHNRSATTADPFLSRSVPLAGSALPDWDMPLSFAFGPSSTSTSNSNSTTTSSSYKSEVTEKFAAPTGMDISLEDLFQSVSQSPTPAAAVSTPVRPAPRTSRSGPFERRELTRWTDTILDEDERTAALGASLPLMSSQARNHRGQSPPASASTSALQSFPNPGASPMASAALPSTPTRPARRHTRTASVPAMGTFPHAMPSTPMGAATIPGSRAEPTNVERANKYANGRFQAAPAATFLPMPSFQA
ncbi:hypothetical protein DL93DRAFT_2165567 [Clavulina sp. PMI_390]|nr:hypothetical protein DL93DRAFT_2165567 [Clavulina sp. PMI_390]